MSTDGGLDTITPEAVNEYLLEGNREVDVPSEVRLIFFPSEKFPRWDVYPADSWLDSASGLYYTGLGYIPGGGKPFPSMSIAKHLIEQLHQSMAASAKTAIRQARAERFLRRH